MNGGLGFARDLKNVLPPSTTNFIQVSITSKMVLVNVIHIIKKPIGLEQANKFDNHHHLMTLLFDI